MGRSQSDSKVTPSDLTEYPLVGLTHFKILSCHLLFVWGCSALLGGAIDSELLH